MTSIAPIAPFDVCVCGDDRPARLAAIDHWECAKCWRKREPIWTVPGDAKLTAALRVAMGCHASKVGESAFTFRERMLAVATYMVENDACAWHASSVLFYLDLPCPCSPCSKAHASKVG